MKNRYTRLWRVLSAVAVFGFVVTMFDLWRDAPLNVIERFTLAALLVTGVLDASVTALCGPERVAVSEDPYGVDDERHACTAGDDE